MNRSIKSNGLLIGFFLGILLSAVVLILSFLLPVFVSSNYSQKNLVQLRNQASAIKHEFSALINHMDLKRKMIMDSPFPEEKDEIFELLKNIDLEPEIEGVGYYTGRGNLNLWLGNIADFIKMPYPRGSAFRFLEQEHSFLIDHKSSVYLAKLQKISSDEFVSFSGSWLSFLNLKLLIWKNTIF